MVGELFLYMLIIILIHYLFCVFENATSRFHSPIYFPHRKTTVVSFWYCAWIFWWFGIQALDFIDFCNVAILATKFSSKCHRFSFFHTPNIFIISLLVIFIMFSQKYYKIPHTRTIIRCHIFYFINLLSFIRIKWNSTHRNIIKITTFIWIFYHWFNYPLWLKSRIEKPNSNNRQTNLSRIRQCHLGTIGKNEYNQIQFTKLHIVWIQEL